MGFDVTALDYVDTLIEKGRAEATRRHITRVQFNVADCRQIDLARQFDCVLCLYDVIGTYADDKENARIAANVAHHLKPGGNVLVSVMNLEVTERRAKHRFTIAREPNKLLALKPSRTMEETGDIFDPEFYILDTETRGLSKRAIRRGHIALAELIVRDRRYTKDQMEAICKNVGLEVVWSRFVRAGNWAEEDDPGRAKEILVYCRKS
jgi:SAM-dependent methyltransferase